jgi:biopolymer transport protein ExbD
MKLPRAELKKARVEIIPMIDAIFFLLVFFMMTSLQLVQMNSKRVDLPESQTAQNRFNEKEKVVVSIAKDGHYFIDQEEAKIAQILPLVSSKIRQNPNTTVIINCDKGQQVAEFVKVFDLIKQANPAKVMIATSPKEPATLVKS